MSEAANNLDGVSGSFDLDGLKKKYRQREVASKPRRALAAIEREILEEIASQSGRIGDRLHTLLDAMQALRRTIEPGLAPPPPGHPNDARTREALNASIRQYNRLRSQAEQVQHHLIIHREAMGFWTHDDVFRCYPIPAPIKLLPPPHLPNPSEGHGEPTG